MARWIDDGSKVLREGEGGESTAMETRVSRSGCAFDAVIRWTNVELGPIFRGRGMWQLRNKRFVVVPLSLCFSRPLCIVSSSHPRVILLFRLWREIPCGWMTIRFQNNRILVLWEFEGNNKSYWSCMHCTLAHESRTGGRILGEKVG